MDNYFGLRFAVIIVLEITLGASIISASSTQSLFAPMILFLLPLSLDYYSHNPIEGKNIKRKNVGIWVPIILSALIAGVLFSQFNFDFLTQSILVKILLWVPFVFFIVLAGIDWTSYSNPNEKEHRELVQRVARSETFDSAQKRVKSLSKEKKRNFNPNEEY